MKAVKDIPKHLKRFTLDQDYKLYTPIDHAGWRFIMNLSKDFFKDHAHSKYLSGLPATGVSTDEIPRIEVMDKCLKKLGWRAAVVSGFIPPAIFLEFLSLGILPIACDMRNFGHLHYTPAPDIVHEAAGHAPILADPEFANYIRKYGEVSQKVIFSSEDLAVYNAIRKLSDVKENPTSNEQEIAVAAHELEEAVSKVSFVSEATQLSRMAWWTIEYGLIGTMENPLIYGAGLLSSMGESYDCFFKNVKRVPLTIDCINVSYDITKPQPQLFVTPNFQHLVDVLEEFSQMMAYRLSPEKGLKKALQARTVTTTEWENGLQVSGILGNVSFDDWMRPSILKWKGYCQFSSGGKELKGFGAKRFKEGLTVFTGPLRPQSAVQFKKSKLGSKPQLTLEFESGAKISGKVSELVRVQKSIKGLFFSKAIINGEAKENILYVISDRIATVFGEAADRGAFYDVVPFMHEPNHSQKTNLTPKNRDLNQLFAKARALRDSRPNGKAGAKIEEIHNELAKNYPNEWLLRIELLEMAVPVDSTLTHKIAEELRSIQKQMPESKDLIDRGLRLFI
jgi:phenylalanine-4-hydroxylase